MIFEEDGAPNPNIPFAERLVEQIAKKIFNTPFSQLDTVMIEVSGLPPAVFEDKTSRLFQVSIRR